MKILAAVVMGIILSSLCNAQQLGTDRSGADKIASDRVVERIREHFGRIASSRFRYQVYPIAKGGLEAIDPYTTHPQYNSDGVLQRFSVWFDFPRRREFIEDVPYRKTGIDRSHSTQIYYDGSTLCTLYPKVKAGIEIKQSGQVQPSRSKFHSAIGILIPGTFHSTLADLLEDKSTVTVRRLTDQERPGEWMIEVRSFPPNILPENLGEQGRRDAIIRIWLTIDPKVVIHRWAIFLPKSEANKPTGDKDVDAVLFGPGVPIFRDEKLMLYEGYVNCDMVSVPDAIRAREYVMPKRVIFGNAAGSYEIKLDEIEINPRFAESTFRAVFPSGFTVTKRTDAGDAQKFLVGGREGESIRVQEISNSAKSILNNDEALRHDNSKYRDYVVSFGAVIVGCAAGVFALYYKRSRK